MRALTCADGSMAVPFNSLPSELAHIDGAHTEGLGCAGALSRSMVGTESYMAPEVVQKQQHDASVDYWSFGVLLFEMLTGDLPYRHKQKKKMLEMIAQAKKPKFPKFLGSVSRTANRQAAFPLGKICLRMVLGCVLFVCTSGLISADSVRSGGGGDHQAADEQAPLRSPNRRRPQAPPILCRHGLEEAAGAGAGAAARAGGRRRTPRHLVIPTRAPLTKLGLL